jgi:hypothetical protein
LGLDILPSAAVNADGGEDVNGYSRVLAAFFPPFYFSLKLREGFTLCAC